MNESKKGVIQKVWQNEKKNSDQTFVWILWSKLSSKFLISSFIWVEQIQCTQRLIISRQFSYVCVWSNQFIVSMNKTNSINLCAIKILPLQDTSSRHQFLKFFKGKYFSRGSLNIFEIWCFEKYWRTWPQKKKKKKKKYNRKKHLPFYLPFLQILRKYPWKSEKFDDGLIPSLKLQWGKANFFIIIIIIIIAVIINIETYF